MHYPNLSSGIRERLSQRGINPEKSTESFLEMIRKDGIPMKLADNIVKAEKTVSQTVEEVIKDLRSYGLAVSPEGAHWKVYDPYSGAWLFDVSKTPSDHNWYWGLRRHLRRIGLIKQEISELAHYRAGSGRKKVAVSVFKGIDLDALKHAQDQAASLGQPIPTLADLDKPIVITKGNEMGTVSAQATRERFNAFMEQYAPVLHKQVVDRKHANGDRVTLDETFNPDRNYFATEFVRTAINEVAPKEGIEAWPSIPAGTQALLALVKPDKANIAEKTALLVEATMDYIENKPEPVYEKVGPLYDGVSSEDELVVYENASGIHVVPEPAPVVPLKQEPVLPQVYTANGLKERYANVLLTLLENSQFDTESLPYILDRLDKLVGVE